MDTHLRTILSVTLLSLSIFLVGGGPTTIRAEQQPPTPTPTEPTIRVVGPDGAIAPIGPPPAVGEVILADDLTAPGALASEPVCPTGRNRGAFTPDGYRLIVTGSCGSPNLADLDAPPINGLVVADGAIRIEARAVSGYDRASIRLMTRFQDDPPRYHSFTLSMKNARLTRSTLRAGLTPLLDLGSAYMAPGTLPPDAWNSLDVRQQGPNVWVLVNDRLMMAFADPAVVGGSVSFGLIREGAASDEDEVSAVFRSLRVSKLAP